MVCVCVCSGLPSGATGALYQALGQGAGYQQCITGNALELLVCSDDHPLLTVLVALVIIIVSKISFFNDATLMTLAVVFTVVKFSMFCACYQQVDASRPSYPVFKLLTRLVNVTSL